MKLAIGILLIVVALYFLVGTVRMWPLGTYGRRYLWPSTRTDRVTGLITVAAACGTGIALICGASWWWLLVAVGAVLVWSVILGRFIKKW